MIAIIAATNEEISPFLSNLNSKNRVEHNKIIFIEGKFLDIPVVVSISGVGIKKARTTTDHIIKKYNPKFIVSAGFAGALNPKLKTGDLVLPEWAASLRAEDKKTFYNSLPYISFKFNKGGILTENRFINNQKDKLDLFLQSGADIVDMETWGVLESAEKNSTKVISARSVSDTTKSKLPRMEMIYSKDSTLDKEKSLNYFKKNPFEIINFLKFKYIDLRKARISLNSFLELLIPILNEL